MNLGERLRRLRESRGLSIYDVERATRLHFSTISRYERNLRQPSLETIRELAALYGVSVLEIVGEDGERAAPEAEVARWVAVFQRRPELRELLVLAEEWPPEAVADLMRLLQYQVK
ncbi:MAG: helix-turn-helix domain-containing protein [Bacillota bacterium]